MKGTNPKGRPPKRQPKPGERVPLGLRVTPELKRALDQAAASSGRSQSQEAEVRLERTFASEHSLLEMLDLAYGCENVALVMTFAELIRSVGSSAALLAMARSKNEHPQASWIEDPFLFNEVVASINEIIESLRPQGEAVAPKNYQENLRDIGKRSAQAVLAILAGQASPDVELVRSGWAERNRKRISHSTMLRIMEATSHNKAG
jgi:hypothetical protein